MTTTRVVRYPPLWKNPDNLQAGFCLKRSNHERQTDFMQIRSTLRTISGIQQISKECTIVLTSEAWRSWLLKGMAMGQETSFVCLTYCLHRYLRCYHEPYIQSNCPAVDPLELKQTINTLLVLGYAVLLMIGWYGEEEGGGIYQKRSHRAKSRTIDAAFKSILLIASSTIIPSILPQIYVYTLAQLCLLVHIFLCDYQYACGDDRPRREPVAAFTAVVLLASQLSNFTSALVFVTASIIAFSFYPDARHRIAKKASYKKLCSEHDFIVSFLQEALFACSCYAAFVALPRINNERLVLVSIQACVCLLFPTLIWYNQRNKCIIKGPWDIAHLKKTSDSDK